MTEKLTQIALPGNGMGNGLADWGEKTAEEMIAQYRSYAQSQLDWASKVLDAKDEDFRIAIVRGSTIQRPVRLLQEGRPKLPKK